MKNKRIPSIAGRIAVSALLIFLAFYMLLPAINLRDRNFFQFLILSILIILVVNFLTFLKDFLSSLLDGGMTIAHRDPVTGQIIFEKRQRKDRPISLERPLKLGFGAIALLLVWMAAATVIGTPLFNAARYRDLITLTDGDFAADIAEIEMKNIPVVDRDSASRLGDRKLGEMTELVSQFEIAGNYTQINYRGTPYRVTPLRYADPIKWFFNRKSGLPAYITVDMVTQQTDLVWLEEGMKYSPSEYFFRNIDRYLRFRYPTKIFDDVSFEIDDSGVPYWVAPTITYRVGWWDGRDIDGAVLVNAVTGECTYYGKEDVPQWIDQLYASDLIITQLDDNGKYQNGYWNSIFGQRNVRRTTYGYNYLALNDDVYLYTGMSSVTADQSNIGFVLVNLRTKETRFYTVPGATEQSAMASAEGQVQHLNYKATFPLLLNISNRPTYFISLKDGAGLVKMYAFVDVEQYQIVGTGQSVTEAEDNYRQALNLEDVALETPAGTEPVSGEIEAIENVVVSGNTCYYFTLSGSEDVYCAPVTLDPRLPFLQPGDSVSFLPAESGSPIQVLEWR